MLKHDITSKSQTMHMR